jgi:hypothetical protein
MTFLPLNSVITPAKITQYLLIPLPKDDKSKFLAQAGYTLENWQQLAMDIKAQILTQPAQLIQETRYGQKYQIKANLTGPNHVTLKTLTIWMTYQNVCRFITLIPDKGE